MPGMRPAARGDRGPWPWAVPRLRDQHRSLLPRRPRGCGLLTRPQAPQDDSGRKATGPPHAGEAIRVGGGPVRPIGPRGGPTRPAVVKQHFEGTKQGRAVQARSSEVPPQGCDRDDGAGCAAGWLPRASRGGGERDPSVPRRDLGRPGGGTAGSPPDPAQASPDSPVSPSGSRLKNGSAEAVPMRLPKKTPAALIQSGIRRLRSGTTNWLS